MKSGASHGKSQRNRAHLPPAPDLTREEYEKRVVVVIIPEQDAPQPPSPDARFWLSTRGMRRFGLPEWEMRNVPPLFIHAAGSIINCWAHYSASTTPVQAGQTIESGGTVPVLLRAIESPDPRWGESAKCLRLVVEAVVRCCNCDGWEGDEDDVPEAS